MTPLFDVEAFTRPNHSPAKTASHGRNANTSRTPGVAPDAAKPVDYWVRGVFRHGEAQMTRTVRSVGMSTRLDADRERFIDHLKTEGWLFPEGRAVLTELLGVGADDGVTMTLSRDKH